MLILSFLVFGLLAGLYGSYLIQYLPQRIIREEQEQIENLQSSLNGGNASPIGTTPTRVNDLIKKNETWIFSILVILVSIGIPLQVGMNAHAFIILLFSWVLLLLACIDWKYQYLPDSLTQPFLWLGLLFQLQPGLGLAEIDNAILGCVLGYLSLRILAYLFFTITRQQGLGHGDMKLFAMIGAWVGAHPLPMIMLIACLLFIGNSFIQYILKKKMGQQYFPFGPYLVAGTFSHMLLSI